MKKLLSQGFTLISLLLFRKRSCKGFTLIELLVVISIIAILSVIGITVFTGVQKGARDAKVKSDIQAYAKAFELKYNNGTYTAPVASDFGSGDFPVDPYPTYSYAVCSCTGAGVCTTAFPLNAVTGTDIVKFIVYGGMEADTGNATDITHTATNCDTVHAAGPAHYYYQKSSQ